MNESVFIHETSVVDLPSSIGRGTQIWHFSHVMANAKIGDNCILGQNVFVGSQAQIGNNVKIQNNVSVYDKVVLENDVFVGPSVVFTNVINPRSFIERKDEYYKTVIGRGASIGANATILCGITIGKFSLIGAGSVITKDIPAYTIVVGVPGTVTGFVCRCGVKLHFTDESNRASCSACQRSFQKDHDTINEV